MNRHRCNAVTALFVLALVMPLVGHAALIDRGSGMIYDTGLNITLLADANYAMTQGYNQFPDTPGAMTWSTAMTWASNLSYGGYTGWRLPTTLQPDATCSDQGYYSTGYNCIGGELGELFYNELGGVAGDSITTTHNSNYDLFRNIYDTRYYWTGTVLPEDNGLAWIFWFFDGSQTDGDTVNRYYAWAVHDGDIGAVPIPAAFWLFGSGLLGLMGVARRKAV